MSQEAERERERIAANEADAKESAVELQSIFDGMHDAIIKAIHRSDIPENERGDIFSRLEMAYRHVRAETDSEYRIRRQANAVNVGFLRSLNDLEAMGRVGWGTTAAFLAKIGVPVRPLTVPESERWLYNLESEKRGVGWDQLNREDSIAVEFGQDPDFAMWFGDESYRSAPEPAGPVTIEGVEYPVYKTDAWQPTTGRFDATMPQAFPGTMPPFTQTVTQTVTMGDSPGASPMSVMSDFYDSQPKEDYPASLYKSAGFGEEPTAEQKIEALNKLRGYGVVPDETIQRWVDALLPIVKQQYAEVSAKEGATIDDLANPLSVEEAHNRLFGMARDASGVPLPVDEDDAKVSAYQGSIKSVEEIQQETAERVLADMKREKAAELLASLSERAMKFRTWLNAKLEGRDHHAVDFDPTYDDWRVAYSGPVSQLSEDALSDGVYYGFARQLGGSHYQESIAFSDRLAAAVDRIATPLINAEASAEKD